MTQYTHDTAPTQFVEAGGIRFGYRRFGAPERTPIGPRVPAAASTSRPLSTTRTAEKAEPSSTTAKQA